MTNRSIIDEIISLQMVRVQKVFALNHSLLVMELFSRRYRRLFLIYDQNPNTASFHVQQVRPIGRKTKFPLVELLNKYATNQYLRVVKLDDEGAAVKALFSHDDKKFTLLFEFFPKYRLGLFRDSELLASFDKNQAPLFRSGFITTVQQDRGLTHNFAHAEMHNAKRRALHQKEAFIHKMAEVKAVLKKKIKLKNNVENDKKKAEQVLLLGANAELLRNNLHALRRGMTQALVIDYTMDPPKERIIELDPRLAPAEFIAQTFNKIKKAQRGIPIISAKLLDIHQEIENLQAELRRLESGDLPDLRREIVDKPIKEKKTQQKRLPYRVYVSSEGVKIFVGRSAKDSDDLTLHYAQSNDWWLHARDVKGAHVVIKCGKSDVSHRTIIEAAMLAANFSDDKLNSHASIQYTRAKNVRKPKGMPPGKVLVAHEKNIDVEIDEKTLKTLLSCEQKSNI